MRNLQRKIFLAECRREVEKEELDAEERENAAHIQLLQTKIAKLKAKLQEQNKVHETTIKEVSKNDDKPVSAKNETVEMWLENLDQKVFELSKKLDLIQHEAKEKEKEAKEQTSQLKQIVQYTKETFANSNADIKLPTAQWLQKLENRSQQVQLKTDEANFVFDRYLKMHQMLLQERLEFQSKVQVMEESLKEQTSELQILKESRTRGHHFQTSAKARMSRYRSKSAKSRAHNDLVASELRARALNQERHRNIAQTRKLASRAEETEGEMEKEASTYLEAFTRIKRVTGVSTIQEVEGHSKHQIESGQQLRNLAKQSQEELEKLYAEQRTLNQEMQQLAQKMAAESNGDEGEEIQEVEREMEEERQKQKMAQEHLDYLDRIKMQVRNGLQHTCNLIASATHNKPTKSLEELSTMELMEFCEKNLGYIVEKLTNEDMNKLLSMQQPVPNVRNETVIKPRAETPSAPLPVEAVLEAESSDEDKTISRVYLKLQAEKIAGQKSKQKSTKRQLLKL